MGSFPGDDEWIRSAVSSGSGHSLLRLQRAERRRAGNRSATHIPECYIFLGRRSTGRGVICKARSMLSRLVTGNITRLIRSARDEVSSVLCANLSKILHTGMENLRKYWNSSGKHLSKRTDCRTAKTDILQLDFSRANLSRKINVS